MRRAMGWVLVLVGMGACAQVEETAGGTGEHAQAACTRLTCAGLGSSCGNFADGCGGVLHCGDCGGGTRCEDAGSGFACVASTVACTPLTCAALGATCGSPADGCGGTLDCGGCAEGEACGGAGIPLACGDPRRSASTAWVQLFDDGIGAIASHPKGGFVALTGTAEGPGLVRLDASGNTVWSRQIVQKWLTLHGVSVAGSGDLYAWGYQYDDSGFPAGTFYRFDPSGQVLAAERTCGYDCGTGPYFGDAQGNVFSLSSGEMYQRLVYRRSDGSGWRYAWYPTGGGESPVGFEVMAPAAWNGVFTAGDVWYPGDAWGTHFGSPVGTTHALLAFGADGGLRWSHEFTRGGRIEALAGDPAGGVSGAGTFSGPLTSREGEVVGSPGHSAFAFHFDPAGQPQWFRRIEASSGAPKVAQGPDGRIAVLTRAWDAAKDCYSARVVELDAGGTPRWSRAFASETCEASFQLGGVAYTGALVVVTGRFRGTAELGDGVRRESGAGWKGFVLGLRAP